MTLHIQTARIQRGFVDADLLDITRATADRMAKRGQVSKGAPFAPSGRLLWPAKRAWAKAADLEAAAKTLTEDALGRPPTALELETRLVRMAEAERLRLDTWEAYRHDYRLEMLASYRADRAAWDALLDRKRVVLGCFCQDRAQCHRGLLAGFLVLMGAVDEGEVGEERGSPVDGDVHDPTT